jgi:hypothetical protein
MTTPDPAAGAREVAHELALMVGRMSLRGDLPEHFAQDLLDPERDGALSILLEAADTPPQGLGADLLGQLAEGLVTSADRVNRSRAVVPLLESLRRHPDLAAGLLTREEVLDALVSGPRRPRLDRALVRVLEAVAPLRAPLTVAAVVRRFGRADVDLDRLARGVTALLLESFDDLAGLALDVGDWMPVDRADLDRLLARVREHPVHLSRLSTRCAEHGRARMLVALTADPALLEASLRDSVATFGILAPPESTDAPGRATYLRVVTNLMRLTALQLLLAERPDLVPAEVADAWPVQDGTRLQVGALDRDGVARLAACLDAHALLVVDG